MKRRHARGNKSPFGIQDEFAATQREPSRKTASSSSFELVVMRRPVPCCTASGGGVSVLIVRSVVVKVTPSATPGTPVTDQMRMRVAVPTSTDAMKRVAVDDREWTGSIVN